MPAIVCCRRRWNAGSDDFVVPSFLAIVFRTLWFIAGLVILLLVLSQDGDCTPFSIDVFIGVLVFLVLQIILQVIILGLETCIMCISAQGTVLDTARRRRLPVVLWIRAIFFILEILLTIYGTLLITSDPNTRLFRRVFTGTSGNANVGDELMSAAMYLNTTQNMDSLLSLDCSGSRSIEEQSVKGLVAISWILQIIISVWFIVYVDPCGCFTGIGPVHVEIENEDEIMNSGNLLTGQELKRRTVMHRQRQRGSLKLTGDIRRVGASTRRFYYYQSIQQRQWLKKLSKLFCCSQAGGAFSRALKDMASGLSIIFHDSDYVLSDLVMGLKLVGQHQRTSEKYFNLEVENMRKWTMEQLDSAQKPADYKYEGPKPLNFNNPDERQVFLDGMHYLKYAVAVYGWPIHMFLDLFCGCCSLCGALRCRHHHPRVPNEIAFDNCLMANTAALKLQANCDEEDILYCSFDNDIYQTPFSVVVDHEKRSVVITIRGSLSLRDAFTDMSISVRKMNVEQEPYCNMKTYVHMGMFATAVTIQNMLFENEVLQRAFEKFPEYRLVVVGHSLGAGAAGVLSVLLREDYPGLVCYTYSPVGCVFNLPLVQYTKTFITSFVIGNDVIPRFTTRSLIHLTDAITTQMKNCQLPKYQVLLPSWVRCLWTGLSARKAPLRDNPSPVENSADEPDAPPEALGVITIAKKYAKVWKEKAQHGQAHSFKQFLRKQETIPTFPPGKIILLREKKCTEKQVPCGGIDSEMEALWCPSEDLGVIKVEKGMLDDHMPNVVVKAFQRVYQELVEPVKDSIAVPPSQPTYNQLVTNECSSEEVTITMLY